MKPPPVSAIIADLTLRAIVDIHLRTCKYCMDISLSVRPVDQQRRQLAVRFYSKWYCAASGVDVLARRSRLVSDTLFVKVQT